MAEGFISQVLDIFVQNIEYKIKDQINTIKQEFKSEAKKITKKLAKAYIVMSMFFGAAVLFIASFVDFLIKVMGISTTVSYFLTSVVLFFIGFIIMEVK